MTFLQSSANGSPSMSIVRIFFNYFFQISNKETRFLLFKKSCPTSDDYDQSNRTFRVVGYRNPSDLPNRISSAQCQSLDETRSWQWYQGHLTQVNSDSFLWFKFILKTFGLFSAKYKIEDENKSRPSNYKTNTTLTIHDIRPEDISSSYICVAINFMGQSEAAIDLQGLSVFISFNFNTW